MDTEKQKPFLYGIQQIGIGVSDAPTALKWYAEKLGADVVIFDDRNIATHMAPYMGGEPHEKRAIMAINMQGGSGYEIWQYTDRIPSAPNDTIRIGDLGINFVLVKSKNIQATLNRLKDGDILTGIHKAADEKPCFYMNDPYGNTLRIQESEEWYKRNRGDTGGTFGCAIGVSDIDRSLKLYADILGYSKVISDRSGFFDDLKELPGGDRKFRRVLLTPSQPRQGGFSRLFGDSQIELLQSLDAKPKKIFDGRYWGDLGFIHLCFDTKNLKALVDECASKGYPFKVISNDDFDMGDTAGFWGYLEDDDGTLIEFVEAYRIPLVKKLGLNLNLKKRSPYKSIPNWIISAMALKRIRF